MRIYLIGYMAAGKTSFGRRLARRLKLNFADTDQYIEEKYGLSVSGLFRENGEENFRRLEREALEELSLRDNIVIATGGGLPCFGDNMQFIKMNGVSIYLKASVAVLCRRLSAAKATRPLLKDKTDQELAASIADMLQKREPFYSQANITVDADDEDRVVEMMILGVRYMG